MSPPAIETPLRIPWSADTLQRSLVAYPRISEVDPAGPQSPELPKIRVRGGAIAVLNRMGDRFAPAGTVRWWRQAGGTTTTASAPHPFGAGADVRAVDFQVGDDGALLLLETVDGAGGDTSRLARLSPDGSARTWDTLDGGPYVRIVADDHGRVLLVSRRDGNTVSELDVGTGALVRRAAAAPGTRAALTANLGATLPAALLARPDPARVAPPAAVPGALVFLFGIDGAGAYYTLVDGQLLAVDFGGKILRRLTLAEHPALSPAATGHIVTRLAPTPDWRVDGDGVVYIPKVGPDAFEVVRVQMK